VPVRLVVVPGVGREKAQILAGRSHREDVEVAAVAHAGERDAAVEYVAGGWGDGHGEEEDGTDEGRGKAQHGCLLGTGLVYLS
jgi:hypothetical protein